MPRFARVMVDDSGGNAFDYELPETLAPSLTIGSRVRVPVRSRTALGTIIEMRDTTEAHGVKLITDVVSATPILNPMLIQLGEWIADYYCCSREAALRAVLPQVIRKAALGHKTQLMVRLSKTPEPDELETLRRKAPLQAGVLDFLSARNGEPILASELTEQCDATHQVVKALEKKGWISAASAKLERDPFQSESFVPAAPLLLNEEQRTVFDRVKAVLAPTSTSGVSGDAAPTNRGIPKPILLHGVTGSGKTEIYLQAIQLVLERGQSAIMRARIAYEHVPPRQPDSRAIAYIPQANQRTSD